MSSICRLQYKTCPEFCLDHLMFDCLSDELETIGMRDKKLVEIRNRKIEHVYLRKIVF
jgi:hypothetical protein